MIEGILKIRKRMQIALQIIFSQFDEIMGPFVAVFFPNDVPKLTQDRVSSMTIDLFTDTEEISNELAIMSFPQLKKKGLVKIIDWKDPTLRGGRSEATLTILFEEKDDPILYKYKDDIEEKINEFLIDFQPLVQKKEKNVILQDKLKKFHKNIQRFLLKLASQELKKFHNKRVKNIWEVLVKTKIIPVNNSKESQKTQEQSMKTEFGFNIFIMGDPGVGKTSMVRKFTDKPFRKSYVPTIAVNYTEKSLFLYDTEFQMILWDLTGPPEFDNSEEFYIDIHSVIIVFDLTKHESFDNIKNWYSVVKNNFSNFNDLEIILCGTKSDLKEEIQISKKKALGLATELNINYLEISALNGKNIEKVFENMINNMIIKYIIKV